MANNKSYISEKLGNNIKTFRRRLKLTQLELSIQADVAERYLQSIETGRRKPSLDVLEKIAKALKIEPYELLK